LEKIKNTKNFKFISISLDEDSLRLKKFIDKNEILKNRDKTFLNFHNRDSIYYITELKKSTSGFSIIATEIPYTVLIKNKKILYKANDDLDIEKLQKLIQENQ
jgi:hypothetical protein